MVWDALELTIQERSKEPDGVVDVAVVLQFSSNFKLRLLLIVRQAVNYDVAMGAAFFFFPC
jgi:hypothetical protein